MLRVSVGSTTAAAVVVAVATSLALLARPSAAQTQHSDAPSLDAGGLLFGDVYHVLSHHTPEGDGATGAVLRRGYLTFDGDFGSSWFGRLRFELNQSGAYETYHFEVGFKDVYVGWKPGRHRVIVGLSPSLTFDLLDGLWGLRYLMRTPMDLQGIASRDVGISVRGPLAMEGALSYRAMVGAGLEFGNESGDGRKWMGAITWRPSPSWTVDLYVDYEVLEGRTDRFTVQGLASFGADNLRWGVLYSHQDRQDDPPLHLASVFGVWRFAEQGSLIGRADRLLEPSPKGDNISYIPFDPTARATMFLLGAEYRVDNRVRITPNAVLITYDLSDEGVRPETDVSLRLTVFVDFE